MTYTPVDNFHALWYILDGIEISLSLIHPGLGQDCGGLVSVMVIF